MKPKTKASATDSTQKVMAAVNPQMLSQETNTRLEAKTTSGTQGACKQLHSMDINDMTNSGSLSPSFPSEQPSPHHGHRTKKASSATTSITNT